MASIFERRLHALEAALVADTSPPRMFICYDNYDDGPPQYTVDGLAADESDWLALVEYARPGIDYVITVTYVDGLESA